jgi:hypothetical protein
MGTGAGPFATPGKVGSGAAAPVINIDLVLNMQGIASGHHLGQVSGWRQGDHQQLRDALAEILEDAAGRLRAGGQIQC